MTAVASTLSGSHQTCDYPCPHRGYYISHGRHNRKHYHFSHTLLLFIRFLFGFDQECSEYLDCDEANDKRTGDPQGDDSRTGSILLLSYPLSRISNVSEATS